MPLADGGGGRKWYHAEHIVSSRAPFCRSRSCWASKGSVASTSRPSWPSPALLRALETAWTSTPRRWLAVWPVISGPPPVYRWVPLSFSFFRSYPSACPYHRSISKRFLSSPSHPSRACYVVNWIWRYVSEGHVDWRSWMGGLVQVGLYADFMYYYRQAWVRGTGMRLPS